MNKFFFFIFYSTKLIAFDCVADAVYLKIAKETGGGVFCHEKSQFAVNDPIFSFDMRYHVKFLAFWKQMGHGSMDSSYYSFEKLPKDSVKLELERFPSEDFKIDKIYAEDKEGKKGSNSELLSKTELESYDKKKTDLYYYKLSPTFKEFQLVIEGKTKQGVPFVQYSPSIYKTINETDAELGRQYWNAVFSFAASKGKKYLENQKEEILKKVFDKN